MTTPATIVASPKTANLFDAHKQWASRPADERFESLNDLRAFTRRVREQAAAREVNLANLVAEDRKGDIALVSTKTGTAVNVGHFAFGQLANRVGAPAAYLRSLPSSLAVANINHGMKGKKTEMANLLIHRPAKDELHLRAITSTSYARIWNADIVDRVAPYVESNGWQVPPARPAFVDQPGTRKATEADVLAGKPWNLSIKVGDDIAPAGLYASEKDIFMFFVDQNRPVNAPGNIPLYRGVFIDNSEVGDRSFGMTTFLYSQVCGNHIVWNSTQVKSTRRRHIGTVDSRSLEDIRGTMSDYANQIASDDENRMKLAASFTLGDDRETVIDNLFTKRIGTQKLLGDAFTACETHPEDGGTPTTAWGMVQGLTRVSQRSQYADERVSIDRIAQRVLGLVN